jgi:hypothetical protein
MTSHINAAVTPTHVWHPAPVTAPSEGWRAVRPAHARSLTDARLQLHHAVQLATALGISYLPKQRDDGHTNLEWAATLGALVSNPVSAPSARVRVGVRLADLTCLVLRDGALVAGFALEGQTISLAEDWIKTRLRESGLDAERYTLARHYEIPAHPVGHGAPFDGREREHFSELATWFGDAASILGALASTTPGAGPVRCWPHHFDFATLLAQGGDRTNGVGMEPGDVYYNEPYFYVNSHPAPPPETLTASLDPGLWHTREWTGAVLPGSRLAPDAAQQEHQVTAFISTAIVALRGTQNI